MNCVSARCSRATAPRITTKRDPEMRAAAAKSSPPGLAPAHTFEVGAGIAPVRNRRVQQVGEPELPALERLLQRRQLRLRALELCGQALATRNEPGHVRAARPAHADRLCGGVA